MRAGARYFRALTIVARVVGVIWTIFGALFILSALRAPPSTGIATPIALGLFGFLVGLGLLFAKPITADAVDAFFQRRR
jgi:hypothetical protein